MVQNADRIGVLDAGKIVEQNLLELLAANGLYASLARKDAVPRRLILNAIGFCRIQGARRH